jgi:hypothetical protein
LVASLKAGSALDRGETDRIAVPQPLNFCVPLTTVIVDRFAQLRPAIWLRAGHTLLIAAVGLCLILVTPDLETAEWSGRPASLG